LAETKRGEEKSTRKSRNCGRRKAQRMGKGPEEARISSSQAEGGLSPGEAAELARKERNKEREG